ncbi:MAG: hypothetical protein HGA31_05475 [Candidatus Moranbacteria bacterium]|nr:hypothetical protein [Candidatus Moranbacteria bacterium]
MKTSKPTVVLAGMDDMPFLVALMRKLFRNSEVLEYPGMTYPHRFYKIPCAEDAASGIAEHMALEVSAIHHKAVVISVAPRAEIKDLFEKRICLDDPTTHEDLESVLTDISMTDALYMLRLGIAIHIPDRPTYSTVLGEEMCLADIDIKAFANRVTLSDLGDSGPNHPFTGYFRGAVFGIEEDEIGLAARTESFVRKIVTEAGYDPILRIAAPKDEYPERYLAGEEGRVYLI